MQFVDLSLDRPLLLAASCSDTQVIESSVRVESEKSVSSCDSLCSLQEVVSHSVAFSYLRVQYSLVGFGGEK